MRFGRSDALVVGLSAAALGTGLWFMAQPAPTEPGIEPLTTATASPKPSATATAALPRLVVIGDEFALPPVAKPDRGWVDLVAGRLRLAPVNLATPGGGFTDRATPVPGCGTPPCSSWMELIGRVKAEDPYLVIVAGGVHDIGKDPREVARSAGALLNALRGAAPRATIAVVKPWAPDDARLEAANVLGAAVADEVTSRGDLWEDVGFPFTASTGGSIAGAPTIEGHTAAARTLVDQLSRQGFSSPSSSG